jgi:hypothetical protein
MFHARPAVGIALDARARQQPDLGASGLAESVVPEDFYLLTLGIVISTGQ